MAVFCVARACKVLPNQTDVELSSRIAFTEMTALSSTGFIGRNDVKGLEALLRGAAKRNSNLLSIGVRNVRGALIIQVGDHEENWTSVEEDAHQSSHMEVPLIASKDGQGGKIELRFTPLHPPGVIGLMKKLDVFVMFIISSSSFLLINLVLSIVLKQLDPSKAGVPKRVREALNSFAEGLLLLDARKTILLANEAFAKATGQDPALLVGKNSSELTFRTDDGSEMPWDCAARENQSISNSRVQFTDCEDRERTYFVNCIPLGQEEKHSGMMVTFDDVTLLEESRKELSQARDEAHAANQAKSDFLANMSHEIRTPMNAILGFTDVLRRGMEENPEQRLDYLNTIHASGNHLIELINDILDLSKVEAGKMDLEVRDFCLPELIHQTIAVLKAKAEAKSIGLNYHIEGKIPETGSSDSTRIRQILINLLGNAIKFTEEGEVALHVTCNRNGLRLDIADSGIGMTPEQQAKIFDPFSQADSSVTRRFGGTGLGLSISKKFAEALGGTISVSSEQGKGSVFTVVVPFPVPEDTRFLSQQECIEFIRENQTGDGRIETAQLKKCKILVVDDGATNRNLISVVLGRQGLDIVEAENGKEGYDYAMENDVDVILMDMQMPVMDGYTATTKLRSEGFKAPIIALTGNAMQGEKQKCLDIGCDDFLPKPIEIDALIATLGRHVGFDERKPEERPAPAKKTSKATQSENPNHSTENAAVETPKRAPAKSTTQSDGVQPWGSSLPMDDEAFREIVQKFVDGLSGKLEEMISALQSEDFDELKSLAHWLKGSGGTMGLGRFTSPARELEIHSQNGETEQCQTILKDLVQLASSIDLDAPPAQESQESWSI